MKQKGELGNTLSNDLSILRLVISAIKEVDDQEEPDQREAEAANDEHQFKIIIE